MPANKVLEFYFHQHGAVLVEWNGSKLLAGIKLSTFVALGCDERERGLSVVMCDV